MKNKSPLKSKRRRLPGQSLDDQIKDRALDGLLGPLFGAIIFVSLALLEWSRVLTGTQPQPIIFSFLALVAAGYAAYRFWRHVPELKRLKLARDGELEVAEILDSLRPSGYHVLNDLLGPTFNIDHVVIGPSGLYTVETKTRMKPARGNAKVLFDGNKVLVDGWAPDRDPVTQARAQAGGLRAVLRESLAREIQIRPVIVFPGWWVETTKGVQSDVWVLNPKALVPFIKNQPDRLDSQDVAIITDHLVRGYAGN